MPNVTLVVPRRCSTWPMYSSNSPTPLGLTSGCWSAPQTSATPTSHGSSLPVSALSCEAGESLHGGNGCLKASDATHTLPL